jgi:uncharacterized repeat protein (TIGR01451 family)
LAIDTDSETLFVTFEFSGILKMVDARTMFVPATGVTAPGASNLAGIVVDQELARVYTIDRHTDNLYVYDWDASTTTLTLVNRYDLPGVSNAFGLALDEVNDILYVTDATVTVKYYSTSDFTTLGGTIALQNIAIGIAVDVPNGFLYTGAGFYSRYHLSQYDLASSTETVVSMGSAGVMGAAVDQDTGLLYVTTGYNEDAIRVYDSNLNKLHQTGRIGNPTGIVVPGKPISYNPLNLTKDDGLAEDACVYQGGSVTYQLCYDNTTNTYAVNNVTLVDTLPSELDFVSATGGGTYNSGTREVTWNIGTLAAGAAQQCVSLSVQLNSSASQGATITNQSSIDSDETGPAFATEDTLVCTNQPPTADANGDYTGDEGSPISLDGTGSSDPDGDPLTYSWSVNSPLCSFDDATSATPDLTCTDNGDFVVTLEVDDGQVTGSDTAGVTVYNVAPTVSIDSVSPTLVAVGELVTADGSFTDPGTNDTHTAVWAWGDTTASAGTVSGLNVGPDSHTYSDAGIYTIQLTVTDDDGGVGTAEYQYVVVYDPSAGFVTGGGWIDSPAGAYRPDTSLAGKANFGFVSKYKKGAEVPEGNTEFQFHTADLNFHSSSYEWLVVTGSDYARFKGVGTINGEGTYKFMLWAGDDDPDTFRIRIWEEDEVTAVETDIYDNGFDQAIGGGSIVIHTKGK